MNTSLTLKGLAELRIRLNTNQMIDRELQEQIKKGYWSFQTSYSEVNCSCEKHCNE